MEEHRIPRALVSEEMREFWLVAFWDGSLDAHATCIYARTSSQGPWGEERLESRLIFGKSRVAPLSGTTISKMELQGLVQCTKSVLKIVKALDVQVDRVVLAGDSMCALMAIRREGAIYRPYFQNRVAHINSNLQAIREQVGVLEETLKIDGACNPADICTRRRAKAEDVGPDSEWQLGPSFLCTPRDQWPLSVPDDPRAVPEQEYRKVKVQAVGDGQVHDRLSRMIENVLERCGSLRKAVGVLARCLRAMGSTGEVKDNVARPLEPRDLEASERLVMYHQQQDVRKLCREGKLDSLTAGLSKGAPKAWRGLVVTHGGFLWRLGNASLDSLCSPSSPLAPGWPS